MSTKTKRWCVFLAVEAIVLGIFVTNTMRLCLYTSKVEKLWSVRQNLQTDNTKSLRYLITFQSEYKYIKIWNLVEIHENALIAQETGAELSFIHMKLSNVPLQLLLRYLFYISMSKITLFLIGIFAWTRTYVCKILTLYSSLANLCHSQWRYIHQRGDLHRVRGQGHSQITWSHIKCQNISNFGLQHSSRYTLSQTSLEQCHP